VYVFSIISFIILIIACINFMNLSTAKSSLRAKEVGMRKVVGSKKRQLMIQFVSESIILSFIVFSLLARLIALITVSFQTIKAASKNPAESLRFE